MNHGPEAPVQIDMTAFQEDRAVNPYGVHFDAEGYTVDHRYDQPAQPQVSQAPAEAVVEYPQTEMFEATAETIDEPAGRLRLAARGLARWVRHKFTRGGNRAEQGESHEADAEAEAFWGEKHSIARAQSFSEQVAEARMQPWERQNIIHADPKTILDTRNNRIRHQACQIFAKRDGRSNIPEEAE